MPSADAAKEDVANLAARMRAVLERQPAELREVRWRQLHFATASVASLRGWLPRLLAQWRSQRRILQAETQAGESLWRKVQGVSRCFPEDAIPGRT